MTNKRSILILDGNLKDGCRVCLEMDTDGDGQLKMFGNLPPNPELARLLETHWQEKYRQIEAPYRIKPEKIEYDGSLVEECRKSARELSARFNDWLKSPSFQNIDLRLREELNPHDDVRVLVCTGDRDLQKLPWHRWDFFDRYANAEVALSLPEFDKPLPSPPSSATVRILAILGHDEGIEVEADRNLLQNWSHAEVEFLVQPQLETVNDRLWEESWDILFFAGHSQTEGDRGIIYINPTDSLTIDELEFGLRQAVARGLQLAIFNSCDGLGLAAQLSNLRIPHMVVMRELVPDLVAQAFLRYFLVMFAGGEPFYLAVRRARERLQGLEGTFPCATWLPVIFEHPDRVAPTWDELWQIEEELPPPTRKSLGWQRILAVGTAATIAVLGVRSLGGLQRWEWGAYDFLMRQRPAEGIDSRILVVEATEEDVNRYGFPLPDGVLAEVLERLQVREPRVIALDIFRDRPVEPGYARLQQLWAQPNLIALCGIGQVDDPNNPGIAPPPGVPENRQGYSDIWVDDDGILRRHVLFLHSDYTDACGTPYSLAGLAALQYLEAEDIVPNTVDRDRMQLGKALFQPLPGNPGAYRNLDDRGFQVLLNYRADAPQTVRISQVLEGSIDPNLVRDRIVLIGVTAPVSNATDYFITPHSAGEWPQEKVAGVLVQAQAMSQILSAALDDRPLLQTWGDWGDGIWIWGWAVAGGIIAGGSRRRWVWGVGTGMAIGLLSGACWGLFVAGKWVPWVPAGLALVATGGGAIAWEEFENLR